MKKEKLLPHSFTIQKTSSGFTKVEMDPVNRVNPYLHLIGQFTLLHQIFPTVSSIKLRVLLFQEDGKSMTVAKQLIKEGCDYSRVDLIKCLADSPSEFLDCHHYWGKLKPFYITTLRESPPGSYFSALNECDKFVICYKCKESSRSYVETVFSPKDIKNLISRYSLSKPIPRPLFVTNEDLVPGLACSIRYVSRKYSL